MEVLRAGLRDLVGMCTDGGRVLARHWPQMIGLFLIGATLRSGFLWLAIVASRYNALVGVLILPLAPLSTLISLVLMLRVTADSLPAFSGLFASLSRAERARGHLSVASQVAIPFLAVYATQGLLDEDVHTWLFDAHWDQIFNGTMKGLTTRTDYADGWTLVAMVVGALVLRKVITVFGLAKKSLVISLGAAYLEVAWMVTLAQSLKTEVNSLIGWVTSRRLIASVFQAWQSLLESLGSWATFITTPVSWVLGVINSMGDLVIVPVAWLAIGAAIYGTKLASGRPIETHEQISQRLSKIPHPLRKVASQAAEPVTTPINDAVSAVRKIADAGLVPMVLFCVVFMIASQLKVGVAWLARLLIGPRDPLLLFSLELHVSLIERLVYFTVALVLVAAAVNRVVLTRVASDEAASVEPASVEPAPIS